MKNYDLKWQIKNPLVQEMDNERVKLNGAVASLERQFVGDPFPYASSTTGREIRDRANKILSRSVELNGTRLNPFDRVVRKDIVYNAKIAKAYHSYFVNQKSAMTVGEFLSAFFVQGTYNKFLDAVRPENLDGLVLSKEEKLRAEMLFKTPDSAIAYYGSSSWSLKHQEKLLEALNNSKGAIGKFYRHLGVETFDYNLELAPAGGGFSYWLSDTLMAAVDSDRFFATSGPYMTALPKLILAHELCHGLHGKKSENFPRGFSPKSWEYSCSLHGPCAEGGALVMEGAYIDYSKKFESMPRDERRILELFWETYLPKKSFQIAHDILERREAEEMYNSAFPESFKKYAHLKLAELTGIKNFSDIFSMDDLPFFDTLQQVSYPIGNENMGNIMACLRKEGVPRKVAFNSILQGVWTSSRAQEEFIFNCYIPALKKQN